MSEREPAGRRGSDPDHTLLGHEHPHGGDWDIEYARPEERRSMTMLLGLILVSVGLAAAAQLMLKHGMNQVVDRTGTSVHFDGRSLKAVAVTPAVWFGLALFGLSAVVWLAVLSRASLSFAYPFAALTYVLIVLFDRFLLHESVPALRWSGVALIIAGIILVSRTPHH